jgi:hypothetical protein
VNGLPKLQPESPNSLTIKHGFPYTLPALGGLQDFAKVDQRSPRKEKHETTLPPGDFDETSALIERVKQTTRPRLSPRKARAQQVKSIYVDSPGVFE